MNKIKIFTHGFSNLIKVSITYTVDLAIGLDLAKECSL